MKTFTVIVEGQGDVDAVSSLIARIGAALGRPAVVTGAPIRSGEAKKLRRPGELERFVELALRRDDSSDVLLLLDLDDDCAASYAREFNRRTAALEQRFGKRVQICFCVREFESWFLASIHSIRVSLPEFRIKDGAAFPKAENTRGAKEEVGRVCLGRKYRESRDQSLFAKKIDVRHCFRESRSFRKLVKAVIGADYGALGKMIEEGV